MGEPVTKTVPHHWTPGQPHPPRLGMRVLFGPAGDPRGARAGTVVAVNEADPLDGQDVAVDFWPEDDPPAPGPVVVKGCLYFTGPPAAVPSSHFFYCHPATKAAEYRLLLDRYRARMGRSDATDPGLWFRLDQLWAAMSRGERDAVVEGHLELSRQTARVELDVSPAGQ
jgi:hypothetical protein